MYNYTRHNLKIIVAFRSIAERSEANVQECTGSGNTKFWSIVDTAKCKLRLYYRPCTKVMPRIIIECYGEAT